MIALADVISAAVRVARLDTRRKSAMLRPTGCVPLQLGKHQAVRIDDFSD
jgi:hypothetical protein